MRNLLLLCAGTVLVVLEITVAPLLAIHGARPDLVVVLVVLVGMLWGWRDAALVGLFIGFIEDACSGQFLGLFMLTRTVVGMGAGMSYARVFQDRVVVPVVLVFLGAFAGGVLHVFLLSSFGVRVVLSVASFKTIVVQALYSAAFAPFLLKGMARLDLCVKRTAERRQAV
ncbi:MAG: rod shape-determining protein MreD [Bacteroidota bacterium]